MQTNPYTLSFGKEPTYVLPRSSIINEITDTFLAEPAPQQTYMIAGVRGSGKTVVMTEIFNLIAAREDWVCLELNPAGDLLEDFAAKLYSHKKTRQVMLDAKIDLSFWGIGVSVERKPSITNIEVILDEMLESVKKKGKKILLTIDEVTSTKEMRAFASAYQIIIRHDFPVFLIMTGLYENIDVLQNDKILTFLHRAPKIYLQPLDIASIAIHYENTFNLSVDKAKEMAHLTKGYPFGFQVLGYFSFKHNGDYIQATPEYQQYLYENVYNKIWSELTPVDKKILYAVATSESNKISEIITKCKMKKNQISPYRDKLIRRGLLDGRQRGYVYLTLPMMEKYIIYSM